jgi:hypothetical protein
MEFAGIWRGGDDAYVLWTGAQWDEFQSKWSQLSGQGQRLVDFETYVDGNGVRRYAGVWRAGTDAHYLWVGVDWNNFQTKWNQLSAQGLRLTVLRTYVDGNTVHYAGVWRAGTDAHYLWAGVDWNNFQAKWSDLSHQNLRLVSFDTCVVNGQRVYSGAWRAGSDAHYLWAGVDWKNFQAKWSELSAQGLRLTVLRTYIDGGVTHYAGVWRAGQDAHYLWAGVNEENFLGKWHQLGGNHLRLIGMPVIGGADSPCSCRVVAPSSYIYYITGEGVPYSWPVVTDGSSHYVRNSALEFSDQIFTLPFNDPAVALWQGWIYNNGGYHHALDFGVDGSHSFQVRAAAPGNVVYIGWDNWSGNTIVVSHADAAGNPDKFRTIYMHLRNGASHDCSTAWNNTVPTLSGQNLTDYTAHLNDTGCTMDPAKRKLDATTWGTDSETIDMTLLGKIVSRGAVLAHAGDTGPGGKRGAGTGSPNIHLHIFFARKDPSDGKWYFFDPYGLYNQRSCYPSAFADPIHHVHAGYGIAWLNGKPTMP